MTDVAATTEQTATNDPNPAIEPAEGSGEQSLDDVLASLQTEDESTPAQPEPIKESDLDKRLGALEADNKQLKRDLQQQQTQEAVSEIIGGMKEDDPKLGMLGETILEAVILDKADKDTRFAKAYALRGHNPEAWKQVKAAFSREIAAQIDVSPNPQLTADAEAARVAVRGTSTSAPAEPASDSKAENVRLSKLTDLELEEEMRQAGA